MFCAQCGTSLIPGGNFCTVCGTSVNANLGKAADLPQSGNGSVPSTISPPPLKIQPLPARPAGPEYRLGGRFARLIAVGIDTIVAIPVLYACYAGSDPETLTNPLSLLMTLFLGLCGVVLVQGLFLAFRAQTIGKMLLGLRIIDVATGRRAGFARLVFLRMLVTSLLSALAGIGWIFGLIDCLFIFREDRRCLHDFIAGTRVVRATRDN